MTDITKLIAKHRPYGLDCKCGEPINSDNSWAKHLTALLMTESGVTAAAKAIARVDTRDTAGRVHLAMARAALASVGLAADSLT